MRVHSADSSAHTGPNTSTYTFRSTHGSTYADRDRNMRANDLVVVRRRQ